MANFNHNEIPRDGLQPVTKSDETILETVDEIARQKGKDSDGNPIRALKQSMTDFLNGMENTVHMMILMLLFFMESIFCGYRIRYKTIGFKDKGLEKYFTDQLKTETIQTAVLHMDDETEFTIAWMSEPNYWVPIPRFPAREAAEALGGEERLLDLAMGNPSQKEIMDFFHTYLSQCSDYEKAEMHHGLSQYDGFERNRTAKPFYEAIMKETDGAESLPAEIKEPIFIDKMLLVSARKGEDGRDVSLVGEAPRAVCVQIDGTTYTGLVPITGQMTQTVKEVDVVLRERLKGLLVTIYLEGKEKPVRKKFFSREHIRYVQNFGPVLLLPAASIMAARTRQILIQMLIPSGIPKSGAWMEGVREETAAVIPRQKNHLMGIHTSRTPMRWLAQPLDEYPDKISFVYTDTKMEELPVDDRERCSGTGKEEAGVILLKPLEKLPLHRKGKLTAGIDFGSSSIKAGWMMAGERAHTSMELAPYQLLTPPIEKFDSLMRRMGLADTRNRTYLPTMVMSYKGNLGEEALQPYLHGVIFPMDNHMGESIFAKDGDSMKRQGIETDLKFGEPSQERENAAKIMAAQMARCIGMKALEEGADELDVRISYPNREVKEHMEEVWKNALREECDNQGIRWKEPSFILESQAIEVYLHSLPPDEAPNRTSPHIILDGGHGTTDLSFVKETKDGQVTVQASIRYAGEAILIDPLVQFLLHREEEFKRLWKDEEHGDNKERELLLDSLAEYARKYKSAASEDGRNGGGEMSAKQILGQMKAMLLLLIETIGFRDLTEYKKMPGYREIERFLTLVRGRFIQLMYLVSACLRGEEPCFDLRIYLAGGIRFALRLCEGMDMSRMNEMPVADTFRQIFRDVFGTGTEVSFHSINSEKRTDIVEGLLADDLDRHTVCRQEEIKLLEKESPYLQAERIPALEQAYRRLTESLKGLSLRRERRSVPFTEYLDIGKGTEDDADWQKENKKLFDRCRDNLYETTVQLDPYMSRELTDALFAVRMSDEILMRNAGWGEN